MGPNGMNTVNTKATVGRGFTQINADQSKSSIFIVSQKLRRESRYASRPESDALSSRTINKKGITVTKKPASKRKSPYFIESKTDTSKFTKKAIKRSTKKFTKYTALSFFIERTFVCASSDAITDKPKDRKPIAIMEPSSPPELCNAFE